jgi:hypothetical protein
MQSYGDRQTRILDNYFVLEWVNENVNLLSLSLSRQIVNRITESGGVERL